MADLVVREVGLSIRSSRRAAQLRPQRETEGIGASGYSPEAMIVNADDLSCKELVELVTEYLEDRLGPPVRTRFEMHLRYCQPCRVYLAQMRETIKLAGRLSEETLPSGSRDALLKAFRGWKRGQGGGT